MPMQDGTGPQGLGPQTGRKMGPCAGSFAGGRRMGMGYGRFCGCCPMCGCQPFKQDEKAMLEDEKKVIDERLAELEKEKE